MRVEGPAFGPVIKALASGLLLALLYWGLRGGGDLMAARWSATNAAFAIAVLLVIALGYYWIMVSRTAVDATHIRQSWMWPKEVALSDITQAKFIYVPYLSWLIAPRLVVRAAGRGFFVFHAASPAVLRAFAKLSLGMPPLDQK
jgi:hypothetical protein